MDVFCISEFKDQFDQLIKKKNYRTIEQEIIDYVFDKQVNDLRTGTNLNQSSTAPFIKKRIAGRGGYRLYYLLVIRKNSVHLAYVHPKTGSLAENNISVNRIKHLQKRVLESIKSGCMFRLSLSENKKQIIFDAIS